MENFHKIAFEKTDKSIFMSDPCGQETILVVEDDEMAGTLAGDMLNELGYSGLVAEDPDRNLWRYRSQQMNMVFLKV
jgi:CheY-like chemotaxis protein